MSIIPTSRALFAALVLSATGCNLISQATSTVVVGGVVVASPALEIPGLYAVPARVTASVWVGERESSTSFEAPTALDDLDVTMSSDQDSVLLEQSTGEPGVYVITSSDAERLAYRPGETYVFDAIVGGEAFGGEVVAPPRITNDALTVTPALESGPLFSAHPKNSALTVSWPRSFGRYGLVAVFRANASDPTQPELVFDNRPQTADDLIALFAGDVPTRIEIPAGAFAEDGVYAVVLAVADRGTIRANTSIVSPLLVGSGTALVFMVGAP